MPYAQSLPLNKQRGSTLAPTAFSTLINPFIATKLWAGWQPWEQSFQKHCICSPQDQERWLSTCGTEAVGLLWMNPTSGMVLRKTAQFGWTCLMLINEQSPLHVLQCSFVPAVKKENLGVNVFNLNYQLLRLLFTGPMFNLSNSVTQLRCFNHLAICNASFLSHQHYCYGDTHSSLTPHYHPWYWAPLHSMTFIFNFAHWFIFDPLDKVVLHIWESVFYQHQMLILCLKLELFHLAFHCTQSRNLPEHLFVGDSAVTAVLDFVSALGRNTPHCSLPASNPEVVLLLYQPFFMPGYWPTFNISLLRFHSLPCPSLLSCHSSCIYSTRKQLLSVISVYRRWIRKTITSNMKKKKAQLTPQTIKCNPCVLFPVCLNCMLLSPNCIRL